LLSKKKNTKVCKTIILPVVLYECGTWSLTSRDDHTLKVFEVRSLRNIWNKRRSKNRQEKIEYFEAV
jgi:hypothetical protein